jgi:hypothetical protein
MGCEQVLGNHACDELTAMWKGWHRHVARSGLMALKELAVREGRLRHKLVQLRPFFLDKLRGTGEWDELTWITKALRRNHQGMLKTLGIYRALTARIKKVSSDVPGWLDSHFQQQQVHMLSLDAVEHANYLLNDQKAPTVPVEYSDFKVPPAQEILWISNS